MEKLSEREKEWLNYIMEKEFLGREILIEQLNNIQVIKESGFDFLSIKMFASQVNKLFPLDIRVPVEMICYQKTTAPVVFLLHIIEGIVNELEIITADASFLDVEKIELMNREYMIDSKLIP
ncbi:hypothetical protein [Bovifimicola ammoniilytica]|jgi:hypothetical protein|uniref:hypothetical protein n=1 Tax=Bovifimicola ammoniilytica TaxID=2981720 RepID=UPI00033783BD|nr:hypothetical protein [Bovifimicola ammoniilytica]MCU6754461.1 hypothetical protein [Bovifimicola ammoniilytica]CCZ03907.1 unknown [Eubacterium sp. CAG:603]SCJ85564.1 Uncharacterised protein [uncultured Eubacterium sp.]